MRDVYNIVKSVKQKYDNMGLTDLVEYTHRAFPEYKRDFTYWDRISEWILKFAVCVPYYSLPEFPLDCKIVTDHAVVIRDILLCNPYNLAHILGGIQIDPHIETLEYMNCQPIVRHGIEKRAEKYDDIRIIFRTRYIGLGYTSKYLVVGYYKVRPEFNQICRGAPIIKASSATFLSIQDSIDITSIMEERKAFRSCFSTENKRWKDHIEKWIADIDQRTNVTQDYAKEIIRLKETYSTYEFKGNDNSYDNCKNCTKENSCFLVRRRQRFGMLQRLPKEYLLWTMQICRILVHVMFLPDVPSEIKRDPQYI